MNSLKKAEQLKEELDKLRPIDAETENRIMQKFRLDWNYHSNNLEGNSLTYGETKALILFGVTAQGKPLKDHFEITGHDEALKWIEEIITDKTRLTEKFIRELHTLLLKETSYKEAKTPEGKPTRRKIEVGKYKIQPNHVVTVTGETFYFASPEETPAKMQELVEWFRREKERQKLNPIILASIFHYRFIRIHPFDDGNGRVARILMNFILMQFGYPPVIVKTEDKENYYAVLRLADSDEIEPFIKYIAKNLVNSLELMVMGAKGGDIEESDDLDKELALLERKVRSKGKKLPLSNNLETFPHIIENSVIPFILDFITVCKKFDKFYNDNKFTLEYDKKDKTPHKKTADKLLSAFRDYTKENSLKELKIHSLHAVFNQEGFEKVGFDYKINIKFERFEYILSDGESKIIKSYGEVFSQDEIQRISRKYAENHRHFIEKQLKSLDD